VSIVIDCDRNLAITTTIKRSTFQVNKRDHYLVNRLGNRPSSNDGAAEWLGHAINRVAPVFKKVWLRGDTDFSLTHNFDRWDEKVGFVFGYDAKRNLIEMADTLPESSWTPLERPARYEVKTEERQRPENVKERVVKQREVTNIRLQSEQVAMGSSSCGGWVQVANNRTTMSTG
jgi:hypothetical protein